MESQPFALPYRDNKTMPLMANSFARNIGCALADAACMRSKTAAQILTAQLKTDADPLSFGLLFLAFQPWTPYVDGQFIKKQTLTSIRDGDYQKGIPVLIGTVRNEAFVYVYEAFTTPMDRTTLVIIVDAVLGPVRAAMALAKYPIPANETDMRTTLSHAVSDLLFHCSVRNASRYLAKTNPVYLFTFDHISSFDNHIWLPDHPECLKYVCHGEDLPYVFDSAEPFEKWTPAEAVIARSFNDLTGGYLNNYDPNSLQRQQPLWPRYEQASSLSYYFKAGGNKVEPFFNRDFCDFWDVAGYGL